MYRRRQECPPGSRNIPPWTAIEECCHLLTSIICGWRADMYFPSQSSSSLFHHAHTHTVVRSLERKRIIIPSTIMIAVWREKKRVSQLPYSTVHVVVIIALFFSHCFFFWYNRRDKNRLGHRETRIASAPTMELQCITYWFVKNPIGRDKNRLRLHYWIAVYYLLVECIGLSYKRDKNGEFWLTYASKILLLRRNPSSQRQ